jgi:hypothetical protein
MSTIIEAFVRQLAGISPGLDAMLEEHLKDNFGEILPHVFLGNITRHAVAISENAESGRSLGARRELKSLLDSMEHTYATGNAEVQELIGASFLENLPRNGEPGSALRKMIGPKLAGQLTKMVLR